VGSALKFLTRYAQEVDEFLDSFVTGDETCVFHHTSESKQVTAMEGEVMTWFEGQVADFYDLGIQKLVPRLWTMSATMLKNKVMYRQLIHSVTFVN
jgi:hypothetical protein